MSKVVVGIDPGIEPSICILDEQGLIIDNVLLKKVGGDFDFEGVSSLFSTISYSFKPENMKVFVEDVHSVFNSSAKANFNFGGSKYAVIQASEILFKTPEMITPKDWQKLVWSESDKVIVGGKRDTKATSLNAAKRILGGQWKDSYFLPTERSHVINHNMVDSFLISYAGYLKNKK